MALYQALRARFPAPPDNHPTVVFHLTLARTQPADLDQVEAMFERTYGVHLPIQAVATEVALYVKRAERWLEKVSFPFGPFLSS